jgi:hypothetical protein
MGSRELPLQGKRLDSLALGADLRLDHSRDPKKKAIEQQFHAQPIDIEQARPNTERRSRPTPCGIGKSQAAQEQQVHNAKRKPKNQVNRARAQR